jgi:hypothetical protein
MFKIFFLLEHKKKTSSIFVKRKINMNDDILGFRLLQKVENQKVFPDMHKQDKAFKIRCSPRARHKIL